MTLVMGKPIFPPYVCIVCGMQNERKWFVDLQLQLDNHFNPVLHGAVYMCNMCFDSMVTDTMNQVQKFEGAAYDGIKPTYSNESELLEEASIGETYGDTGGTDERTVRDSSTAGVDPQPSISFESNPATEPESPDDSDDDPNLSDFRVHFGKVG